MASNNVVWQPQVVDEMLRYYKEKIQSEGKQFVFKETHHEECAKQINAKFTTAFTQKQVYHKFHKLKGQWKIILEAKNLSGANFDDVNKIILYDDTEVVRMKNNKDKRAKYINVPIANFDEMEFIFQDKHATGEFTVLQTPYDRVHARDKDFIGDTEKSAIDIEVDPATQYDSDCLPDDTNNESSSSKRPRGGKRDKGKRVKCAESVVQDMTRSLRDMSDTMHFTHVTNPNENLFKIIDDMEEYPLFVRLSLQTSLATNEQVASMLKGRPMAAIQEFVRRWVRDNFPEHVHHRP
ncbi:unnamed protein product [Triticum turgidum subsp. durum]|uniref:Myb/SANT-like domain-containing protein n=1 Tax=Triticum turgidum subsp. durum TaxID=4567 RepID=A0A9R0XDL4_TRITD|nr:unnamed protein product [Triticum turgidum subsp. durum]